MNDDEAMALAFRYARQFFKSDANNIPELTMLFGAYCIQQITEMVVKHFSLAKENLV